jgi:hypothetical protein
MTTMTTAKMSTPMSSEKSGLMDAAAGGGGRRALGSGTAIR